MQTQITANLPDATYVEKKMQELWLKTKELTGGEEKMELMDEISIFLLKLFLDHKLVMLKHMSQLKEVFGNISSNQANKICQVIHSLI